MAAFLTVTIDTEEEWDWSAGYPTEGFTVRNVERLPAFQDLCDRFGLAATYFANLAVVTDPAARQVLVGLAGRDRVEVGMHIHPWNTPPLDPRQPVRERETYLHNLPDDVIRAKLQTVYDAFRQAGLRPTSFRGGRYSTGPVIQEFLRTKGFVADASVVPDTFWPVDGAPDYRARGLDPVRRPGKTAAEGALWEVPLTRGFTRGPDEFWRYWYDLIATSPLARLRLIGMAERLGIVRKVWLNIEQNSVEDMLAFLHRLGTMDVPCVCLTFHSSSLWPGGNPYARTVADVERLLGRLATLFEQVVRAGFVPATVSDVARRLEAAFHARARH